MSINEGRGPVKLCCRKKNCCQRKMSIKAKAKTKEENRERGERQYVTNPLQRWHESNTASTSHILSCVGNLEIMLRRFEIS
jgi:hypothetical protein